MKNLLFAIALVFSHIAIGQDNQKIQLANEYYMQGDADKALDIYEDLSNDLRAIPLIHTNYFGLLLSTKDFKTAKKYIQRLNKTYPNNIYYQVDYGMLLSEQSEDEAASKQLNDVINLAKEDQYKLRVTAQYFLSKQLYSYALQTYLVGRKSNNQSYAYALELANIHRVMGNKDLMVEEYLNFASANPSNLNYVKNILQNLLTENEDLIWVNLQRKNFYGAFLQARALEKRTKGDGGKLLDIGMIALDNQAYDDAVEIFTYITAEYEGTINYILSRKLTINAREGIVKNTFPVNSIEIRKLVNDYQQLVEDMGINKNTLEALRNKALLHAFYLDEKDIATEILQDVINTPRIDRQLQANCKLDLGDIYLLIGEPWESTLLYSQVEKANKDTPTGYKAKLKNAKLNYYKGNFELAKGHLDILKLATSREIANDAIALSVLIQDNTALDTSDYVMKEYAAIDLLLFQNQYEGAKQDLMLMLEKYPGHSLTDEIWWSLANVHKQLGEFESAITYLDKIVSEYEYDILSDDAYFVMATIYEDQLRDNQKAMELYQEFLKIHPGSKFIAEARLRFRQLRGDFIN
jgi:tetratricopeptide (TPR) repeat protein